MDNRYMETCENCNGERVVASWDWIEWKDAHRNKYLELTKQGMKPAEAWVKAAETVGETPDEPEETPCPDCEGRGMVPTKEGRELLRFLETFK